jgi:hypothetical protein
MSGVVDLIHRGEVTGVKGVVALLHAREQVSFAASRAAVLSLSPPWQPR